MFADILLGPQPCAAPGSGQQPFIRLLASKRQATRAQKANAAGRWAQQPRGGHSAWDAPLCPCRSVCSGGTSGVLLRECCFSTLGSSNADTRCAAWHSLSGDARATPHRRGSAGTSFRNCRCATRFVPACCVLCFAEQTASSVADRTQLPLFLFGALRRPAPSLVFVWRRHVWWTRTKHGAVLRW